MKVIIDVNTGYFDAKLIFESLDGDTIKVSIPYEANVSRSKVITLKKSNEPAKFALAEFMMKNQQHRIFPEWSEKSLITEYHLIDGWMFDEWLVEEWFNRQKKQEKHMNLESLVGKTVRFTVKCDNDRTGTLTYPDYDGESIIGAFFKNIQCKIDGQSYGFDGEVVEIMKIETYHHEWSEVK